MRVAAFDPGATTGIVVLDTNLDMHYHNQIDEEGIEYPDKGEGWWSATSMCSVWVVEDWRNWGQGDGQRAWAAEVIGMLRIINKLRDPQDPQIPIVRQLPRNVKDFCTDRTLERAGIVGLRRHERDAARHALYYLITKGKVERNIWQES